MRKCLIVLWFGKFPDYFHLFLKSCEWNPNWNWLIYTDQEISGFSIPENVKIQLIQFDKMKERIGKCLGIELSSKAEPYKLCDIRPMYGLIFSAELAAGYEYWGHCDIDVIWGNLSKFYPDDLISKYDRFLCLGHLTLYRNNVDNNTLFKRTLFRDVDYKLIVKSRYNWDFDECVSRYSLFKTQERERNYRIYNSIESVADVLPWNGFSVITEHKLGSSVKVKPLKYVKVDRGLILVRFIDESYEIEKAYAHFQKRFFTTQPIDLSKPYYVFSNSICQNSVSQGEIFLKNPKSSVQKKLIQIMKVVEILKYKCSKIKTVDYMEEI